MNRRYLPSREKGVVLILALMIVALVTIIAVSVSWRFTLGMARNENRWHGSQARSYMEGGEQLARKILLEDMREAPNVDHLGELWAQSGEPLPTDEGWIRGTIEDAHSRFNLNLLIRPQQQPGNPNNNQRNNLTAWDLFSESQRRFVRLLQTIELESGPVDLQTAMEITEAIQDWLDPDDQPSGFGGAEADYYLGLDPPYPITNGPMTSVSELSLVKGMTPELYEKLVPLVIALPSGEPMNFNTLKPAILRSLNAKEIQVPLAEAEWLALQEERAARVDGITDLNEFFNGTAGAIVSGAGQFDSSDLTTTSSYFLLMAETLVGEQVRRSKTLLYRGALNGVHHVHVVRRTDSNF